MDEDLIDHQKKCRFCIGRIKSTRIAVQITEEIEQSFFSLTNTKLKTSKNYSSTICKACLKDLESSIGFKQKIIVNQQRLEKFEFEDACAVKEEAVESEDLQTMEIKTECFEFELLPVVQSWQEPLKDEVNISQEDVPEVSPTSADSDDNFITKSHEDESSDSYLIEEPAKQEEKTQKVPETSQSRICPYCAIQFSVSGITAHIERHENEMNNTPLKCQFCDRQFYSSADIVCHVKSKHPEKHRGKAKKAKGVISTSMERRKIILDAHLANPLMSYGCLAKKLKLNKSTVGRFLKRYKTTKTIHNAPKTSGFRTGDKEVYDKIARSFRTNPEWSDGVRAAKLGSSRAVVAKVRRRVGFQRIVDETTRVYQCQQCPRKYSHNTTLTAHIKEKHRIPTD